MLFRTALLACLLLGACARTPAPLPGTAPAAPGAEPSFPRGTALPPPGLGAPPR